MAEKKCPNCGSLASDLLRIDAGLKARLRETGGIASPPDEACTNCYNQMTSAISQGAQLRAKQMAREQQRMIMWRNRVNLLKQARQKMGQRSFSEAATLYEKYIRILELIYDVKPGELKPDFFMNKAREQELTVISSVFWDLVRIYDSSPLYGERQQKAAAKLIEFGKHSGSAMNKIIKQAQAFIPTAKNAKVVQNIIKATNKKRGRCFIASATFNSPKAPEVVLLSSFRDQVLSRFILGRCFIETYYFISPPIASWLDRHPKAKKPVKFALRKLTKAISRYFNLQS